MKNKQESTRLASVIAVAFVLAASGGASAQSEQGPLDAEIKDFTADVTGNEQCTGYKWYDADADAALDDATTPDDGFGIVVGLAFVAVLIASEIEPADPPDEDLGDLNWQIQCTGDVTASANGHGGVLRRVSIQAPDPRTGEYVDAGTSCTYDGIEDSDCPTPATAKLPQERAPLEAGSMPYPYDETYPTAMDFCISSQIRAINHGTEEATEVVSPPVTQNYMGEACAQDVDITWTNSPPPNLAAILEQA